MDLLNGSLGKLYRKFLLTSFGSALISSIYTLVDMIMVGQYHGPDGSAAMAVIAPIWNIVYSFGLLIGIGGSVLYSVLRGKNGDIKRANTYFTASVIFGSAVAIILWVLLWVAEEPLLRLFGANDTLLPLCKEYLVAPKLTVPFYVFINILSAFLRNDSDPGRATKAVIAGGVFNVFGDYFFVFTLDMGIKGAGIATAMGAGISVIFMLSHFFSKGNTLRLAKPQTLFPTFGKISANGFSTFIIDVAMGVLTMLFNRQIMKYLGSDALAVYGVIVTVTTFVQCCAYGVGQASQPIISQNYGAGKFDRIHTMLKYNIVTSAILGVLWVGICLAIPNGFMKAFMKPTAAVLSIAPPIFRAYTLSYLLLPFNVYCTYYFQATMKAGTAIFISIARGIVVSGALIMILPALLGGSAIWWAMPITEAATTIYAFITIKRQNKLMLRG